LLFGEIRKLKLFAIKNENGETFITFFVIKRYICSKITKNLNNFKEIPAKNEE